MLALPENPTNEQSPLSPFITFHTLWKVTAVYGFGVSTYIMVHLLTNHPTHAVFIFGTVAQCLTLQLSNYPIKVLVCIIIQYWSQYQYIKFMLLRFDWWVLEGLLEGHNIVFLVNKPTAIGSTQLICMWPHPHIHLHVPMLTHVSEKWLCRFHPLTHSLN